MSGINPQYPDIDWLRARAKKRIPGFAFDYLDGGCNAGINLKRNTEEIRELQLKPYYLRKFENLSLKKTLLGKEYDLPFGICPIGLQGMIWPRATEILAKAAFDYNIPFMLSTVATASLEKVAEITEGNAWFQLYHPVEDKLRDDMIRRLKEAGYPTLVLLSDVPAFGYRAKEIRNGLSIPPKMTARNIYQIMTKPNWAINTLIAGAPQFQTLKPYIPKGLNLSHLGMFMNQTFNGRLSEEKIKKIRDMWPGKLVIKGIVADEDVEKTINAGVDGIIVSNHGGRQLDHGESTIRPTMDIAKKYKGKIAIMMDSGIRTGPDIATTLAAGADFAFLGRSFMYSVAALGNKGGEQAIEILKAQLTQVMQQLCCEKVEDLPNHLIK